MTTFLILTKIALAAVLRSRHFFGRLRLRTSEVPELTPAPTKLGWLRLRLQVIFDARTRLLFFACLRFSRSAPALGSEQKKICSGSGAVRKVVAPGGSGSATLPSSTSFGQLQKKDKYRRKGKVRRCCLGDRAY